MGDGPSSRHVEEGDCSSDRDWPSLTFTRVNLPSVRPTCQDKAARQRWRTGDDAIGEDAAANGAMMVRTQDQRSSTAATEAMQVG